MSEFNQGKREGLELAAKICEECAHVCLTNMDAYDSNAAACYRFRAEEFRKLASEVAV